MGVQWCDGVYSPYTLFKLSTMVRQYVQSIYTVQTQYNGVTVCTVHIHCSNSVQWCDGVYSSYTLFKLSTMVRRCVQSIYTVQTQYNGVTVCSVHIHCSNSVQWCDGVSTPIFRSSVQHCGLLL